MSIRPRRRPTVHKSIGTTSLTKPAEKVIQTQFDWKTYFCFLKLLLHCVGHQLLLGTLRADDILGIGDEAFAHQRGLAGGAAEAVVVPVPALEGDEPRAADAWKVI